MTTDDYVALTTSQHRDKPNFQAFLRMITQPLVDNQALLVAMRTSTFDLDTAVGVQLDAVGLWVGIGRIVNVPITGVYFTWQDIVADGWGRGFWKGPFDPATGIVSLDDDTYRIVIRAKILANSWDGTVQSLCAFWDWLFGAGVVKVTDNLDMTATLTYTAAALNAVQTSLLTNGAFFHKPGGVHFNYVSA